MSKPIEFKTESIDAAEAMADRILANRNAKLDELQKLIENDDAAIEAAEVAAMQATDKSDLEAFQAAKRDKQNAIDAKEMHTNLRATLCKKPLIAKSDYDATIAAIYEEAHADEAEAIAELAELTERMSKIADGLEALRLRANHALHRVQNDVYRNADRPRSERGTLLATGEKKVSFEGCYKWGKAATDTIGYKQYLQKKAEAAAE